MKNTIPTFIINLEKREDRKKHIIQEFKGKPEFDIQIVKAIEHNVGSVGLWKSMVHIVEDLIDKKADFFLLMEDDHKFTNNYSYKLLEQQIQFAQKLNAEILLGGVSWFDLSIPISNHLFWIDHFNATQFVIVFRPLYEKILAEKDNYYDTPDIRISKLTDKKFLFYPFISTQMEFGYSDATDFNNEVGYVTEIFSASEKRLECYNKVANYYNEIL